MLCLTHATFTDWRTQRVVRGHLVVHPGEDGAVEVVESVPRGAETLDCRGKLVTKSFVVGHHHIYSALARGMPPPKRAPRSFAEILELIWWNLDKQLDRDMIRASALVTACEALKCGATFIIDHHASPRAVPESLHVIAGALDEVGVGHLCCYELSDRDGPAALEQGFAETEAYLKKHQGLVGLHASFTVSESTLSRAVELARKYDTGLHVHVAEDEIDERQAVEKYGRRVLERFGDAGVLDSQKTILAHGLHLDDAERARFAASRAFIAQNSESNQNNAVGSFTARGLGDRIFLGTDGMHSDMLQSTKAAYLAAQGREPMTPRDAYRRLRRVHDYLSDNGFAGDGDNNLVVLDYDSPTAVTWDNWPAHVCYGLTSRHVWAVVKDGRVVLKERRVVHVDEAAVYAEARAQAEALWKRL